MRAATYSKKLLCCLAAALLIALPAGPGLALAAALPSADGAVARVTDGNGAPAYYATLPEAVDAAPAGATVTLLTDTALHVDASSGSTVVMRINKALTLDGDGHAVTLEKNGIAVGAVDGTPGAERYDVTFRDITMTNAAAYGRIVTLGGGVGSFTCDDVVMRTTGAGNTQVITMGYNAPDTTAIKLNGSTIQASTAGYGIITFNPVDLTIADSDVSGYGAIYIKGKDSSAGSSGSVVNIIDGSTVSSTGIAGSSNEFGTIVMQGVKDVKVNVENATVTAKAADGQPATAQSVLQFSTYADQQNDAAQSNAVTFGQGATVRGVGKNSALASGNFQKNAIEAHDGNFELQGAVFVTGDDPAGTDLKVTGGKWNRDMAAYVPDGYVSTHENGAPYVVAQKEAQSTGDEGNKATPSDPTQPATPSGTTPDSSAKATDVATPSGSAKAADATSQASDPNARANVQQTGDGELPLVAGAAVVIAAASIGLLMRRRSEGGCS